MNRPFYAEVPKDYVDNLEYRAKLRTWADRNPQRQRQLVAMCALDTLWFVNTWLYVLEPRNPPATRVQPFITWPEQDDYFGAMDECWGRADLIAEKRRAAGFSWCTTMMAFKEWLTKPYTLIGLVSKDEISVDNPQDPDSLMFKLDWQLQQLPTWMRPIVKRNVNEHTLVNTANGSGFAGFAATGNAGTGGRKTAFILDELAKWRRGPDREVLDSTQYVTDCRIMGSSYFGRSGVFYDKAKHDPSIRKFVFDWKTNFHCNRGLYRVKDGKVVVLDPVDAPLTQELLDRVIGRVVPPKDGEHVDLTHIHKLLKDKGFDLEGTTRSPWYDGECLRSTGPQSIAQELDRDPQGTEVNFIDPAMLRQLLEGEGEARTMCSPKYRGRLHFNPTTLEPWFEERPDGDLLVWCDLEKYEKDGRELLRPLRDRNYGVGADISFGVGRSNSAAEVLDFQTGRQAAEYVTKFKRPHEFAHYAIALSKWFAGRDGDGAYLCWEANAGGGTHFSQAVIDFGYGNVYRRKKQGEITETTTKQIGWHSSGGDKSEILGGVGGGGLIEALAAGTVKFHSEAMLRECGEYVIDDQMKVVHLKSRLKDNPAAQGEAHGDRVIASAIVVMLWRERPEPLKTEGPSAVFPPYSHGARCQELDAQQASLALSRNEFVYQ